MFQLSEPKITTRGPYKVVGCYCEFQGGDEGPGWAGADAAFWPRKDEIKNRVDDMALGFLYRPHQDHPEIAPEVKAGFVGVEVTDFDSVPAAMSTTQFSGGEYVIVACQGDNPGETAEGVGAAIGQLMEWIPAHGYTEGDACFSAGSESAPKPPYIEYVYIKLEKKPERVQRLSIGNS